MGCGCNSTSDAYLSCAGISPVYSDEQVVNYSTRVGATGGTGNWVTCYSNACLRILRLIYWKQSLGDCGTSTRVQPNVNQILGGKLKAVAATDPEPISNAVLNIAGAIAGIFGAHHAQAVQNEQKLGCDAMQQYNSFADAMERALSSGAISLPDAIAQLQQVCSQIRSGLGQIVKPVNMAYGMQRALDALLLFNKEVIYPALMPAPSLMGSIFGSGYQQQNGPGSANSTPADGSRSYGAPIAIGAGIVGAKIIGIF